MSPISEISPIRKSILKELGMVGTSHAATALGRMISGRIMLTPTELSVAPLKDVYKLFDAREDLHVGVYTTMKRDVSGTMLFFLPNDEVYPLVDILMGQKVGTTHLLGEMEQSTIKEVGNILCASYINAIADLARIGIEITEPKLIYDNRGKVIHAVLQGETGDRAMTIFIKNTFSNDVASISGLFLMVLNPEDLQKLLLSLEEKVK